VLAWADKYRTLRVFANADTPDDVETARKNGAEGIGLVRTEHMVGRRASGCPFIIIIITD